MEESHKSKSLMMITKPVTTSKHEFCNHLVEISKIIILRIFTISFFFNRNSNPNPIIIFDSNYHALVQLS